LKQQEGFVALLPLLLPALRLLLLPPMLLLLLLLLLPTLSWWDLALLLC
jgi:hypothetical protein